MQDCTGLRSGWSTSREALSHATARTEAGKSTALKRPAFAARGAGVDVKFPHDLPPINAVLRVDWGHAGPLDLEVYSLLD